MTKILIIGTLLILIITQSCHTEHRTNKTLGDYLKDKNINSIKIESFAKDSFYVLPNSNAIFAKMEKIKKSTGIWKYSPKRKLIIAYSSLKIDTLFTNGRVFQFGDLFFVRSTYLFEVPGHKTEKYLKTDEINADHKGLNQRKCISYTELVKDNNLLKAMSDSCVLNIFDTIKAKALGDNDNFTSYNLLFNISERSDGWVSELCVSLISELFITDNTKFASFYQSKENPSTSKFYQFLKEGLCIYVYDSNDPVIRKEKLLKKIDNLSVSSSKTQFKKMLNEMNASLCE